MLELKECKRNNLCIDCDDTECFLAGKIISDCPKYHCDRDKEHIQDCQSCDFIKQFQAEMRKED